MIESIEQNILLTLMRENKQNQPVRYLLFFFNSNFKETVPLRFRDKLLSCRVLFSRLWNVTTRFLGLLFVCFCSNAIHIFQKLEFPFKFALTLIRYNLFSTYRKFSKKLISNHLTGTRTCTCQSVRHVGFSQNFVYVLSE